MDGNTNEERKKIMSKQYCPECGQLLLNDRYYNLDEIAASCRQARENKK
jgi:hypothetical protein